MKYKYDFDTVVCRSNTYSLKYEPKLYAKNFKGAVENAMPFWVADMDFNTAPCIHDAVKRRADHGIFGYTSPLDNFYAALKWWQKTRHNVDIDEKDVSLFSGVVSILAHAVKAFTQEGDGVIIQQPVYHPFANVIVENNREMINNKLVYDGQNYTIDFNDLEQKASDPNTKLLILCNPHNPVGRVWTKEELEKLADICYRNNVIVVSDEIHGDLILGENKFISYGTLDDKYVQNSVICASITKTFNLAGLTLGYAIVKDNDIKQKLDKAHSQSHYMVNMFAVEATMAAYTQQGADWLDELCKYLTRSSEIIDEFLKENLPLAVYKKPQATYLGWIDCSKYINDDNDLKKIIPASGVLVNYGTSFGAGGEGFIRWNFACAHEVLVQGLELLAKALK